jgi:hypothetical protein
VKITLEPTADLYLAATLVPATDEGQVCRLWKGTTDDGVEVHAYILCVSPQTHDEGTALRFATELMERNAVVRE